MEARSTVDKSLRLACRWWLGVSASFIAFTALSVAFGGLGTLLRCVQPDPLSITAQTLACTGFIWLVAGVALALLSGPQRRLRYGWQIVFTSVLLILYLNILRERPHYIDVQDYVQAAWDLQSGVPFHIRYLYPPFLATLCQPFLGLGQDGLAALFWCANWCGFVLFFILLTQTLQAYGFESRLSGLCVFLFMLVNVPVLRTLSFVQVNFHMMNLILLAVLLYPRHRILSALMLALAIHLKASPLVVALPFICLCDKKWILSLVLFGCAGIALTVMFFGWEPYFSFFANIKTIYHANGISFRENSIDAVVRTLAIAMRKSGDAWVPFVKIPILFGVLGCLLYTARKCLWTTKTEAFGRLLNGLPLSLVLMVFASPLVWEHHFIFLAVPFLLIIRKLMAAGEWVAYGGAYLCVYLLPTFDFYPWSFCRLFGTGVLIVLCLRLSGRRDAPWFEAMQRRFRQGFSEDAFRTT